jgi:hypothetical protein
MRSDDYAKSRSILSTCAINDAYIRSAIFGLLAVIGVIAGAKLAPAWFFVLEPVMNFFKEKACTM